MTFTPGTTGSSSGDKIFCLPSTAKAGQTLILDKDSH